MSFLFNAINQVNEKFVNAGSHNSDVGMISGFTGIDVYTSNMAYNEELDLNLINGGLFNSAYNGVGISSAGKTTLWIQYISAAMDMWNAKYGDVTECTFFNIEGHTSVTRWKQLTGYTDEMMIDRVKFIDQSMSIAEIMEQIAILAEFKLENAKKIEIDTGMRSIKGGSIKTLPTSYVLIDSISSVRRTTKDLEFTKDGSVKGYENVGGSNNMDAMSIAKDNTVFINEVKKLCEQAKICVVLINHLVKHTPLGPFDRPKAMLPSLPADVKSKGGAELIFQSFGVFMLSVKDKFFNDKDKSYGDTIHGMSSWFTFAKNKNGKEGVQIPLVFDSETGFKPELSDFELLTVQHMNYGISGSPMSYSLDILPEIKFTKKTLISKCYDNPLLARALGFTARLKLICDLLLKCEAPDLKLFSQLPYDVRVYLILRYSVYYPAYVNRGLLVNEEDMKLYENMIKNIKYSYTYNEFPKPDVLDFIRETNGDLIFTSEKFDNDDFKSKPIKVGGFEYLMK